MRESNRRGMSAQRGWTCCDFDWAAVLLLSWVASECFGGMRPSAA